MDQFANVPLEFIRLDLDLPAGWQALVGSGYKVQATALAGR